MANGKLHRAVGSAAGAVNALARSHDLGPWPALAESAGGFCGGWVGGALPDVLEPATSPRHRGPLHSWTTATGLLTYGNEGLSAFQTRCRERAVLAEERFAAARGLEAVVPAMAALFWRFLSGFLAGLQGGYVSHLALDAVTPAGLPALG